MILSNWVLVVLCFIGFALSYNRGDLLCFGFGASIMATEIGRKSALRIFLGGLYFLFLLGVGGCSSGGAWLPSAGPSGENIVEAQLDSRLQFRVLEVDDSLVRRLVAAEKRTKFSDAFFGDQVKGITVGPGDVLEISVWEAPPATLFGMASLDSRTGVMTSSVTTFPEQMVGRNGAITVPFAGSVAVEGKTIQAIEQEIVKKLSGKANLPQVMVRVTRNATSNVTVVGEVGQSIRMPLTAKGERLLDAIAGAGGVRQAVGKISIQVTRGDFVYTMPLDGVIQDPKQNIVLHAGDVVTALYQPISFTALGATGKNEEVPFEAHGINLAQAIARSGGVQDSRGDARGVFVFRFEEPLVLGVAAEQAQLTPDGRIPVVYRIDFKNPASFFVAQSFQVRNRDVIYIANAPAAELQKFLSILTSSIFSVNGLVNLSR